MRLWKSSNANGKSGWQKPSEEVRDLLMDFGDIVPIGQSVWVTLGRKKLPSYLRGSEAVREARRWVMVLTRRGKVILRYKRGNTRFLDAMRARA